MSDLTLTASIDTRQAKQDIQALRKYAEAQLGNGLNIRTPGGAAKALAAVGGGSNDAFAKLDKATRSLSSAFQRLGTDLAGC